MVGQARDRNNRQNRGGRNHRRRRGHSAAYITRDTVRSRARGAHAHGNAAGQVVDGLRTEVCGQQQQSNDPRNNQHNPQYANYWAPLTRKRHIPPHPAQPRHTNYWAPRTRKRHQREHRPQRPTERSDPTQHAKGRPGDCPGPRKETTTGRNVTQGGGGGGGARDALQAKGPQGPPGQGGGGVRGQTRVCVPQIGLRPRAPSMDVALSRGEIVVRGWGGRLAGPWRPESA